MWCWLECHCIWALMGLCATLPCNLNKWLWLSQKRKLWFFTGWFGLNGKLFYFIALTFARTLNEPITPWCFWARKELLFGIEFLLIFSVLQWLFQHRSMKGRKWEKAKQGRRWGKGVTARGLAPDAPLIGKYCCWILIMADCMIWVNPNTCSSPLAPLPCSDSSRRVPYLAFCWGTEQETGWAGSEPWSDAPDWSAALMFASILHTSYEDENEQTLL